MRDLDNHFGAYNHLAHLPRADEALHTLRKAASCVKPLMRKRGWRVGILSEFLPDQPNLLGLNTNRGEHIQLRLRHPYSSNQFLPFEQVLDTLLHELCHNVWGPHDEKFHRLWNELRDDWETLQMRGFSGEGFLGKGQALGGSRIPVEEVRRRARAAAQERAKLNKQKHDPGRRLGGSSSAQRSSSRRRLRDLLAGAAQSRTKANTAQVDSGCATGTQAGTKAAEDALANGFRTKAEMDDANSIAIAQALQELYEQEEDNRIYDGLAGPPSTGGLVWDPELGLQPASANGSPAGSSTHLPLPSRSDSPASSLRSNTKSAPPEFNPRGNPVSRLVREAEAERRGSPPEPQDPTPAIQYWPTSETGANFGSAQTSSSSANDGSWGCPQCTFNNHGAMSRCEICDAPRPSSTSSKRVPKVINATPRPLGTRSAYDTAQSFAQQEAAKPLGWVCESCGNWTERQFWTCSMCGTMKRTS